MIPPAPELDRAVPRRNQNACFDKPQKYLNARFSLGEDVVDNICFPFLLLLLSLLLSFRLLLADTLRIGAADRPSTGEDDVLARFVNGIIRRYGTYSSLFTSQKQFGPWLL